MEARAPGWPEGAGAARGRAYAPWPNGPVVSNTAPREGSEAALEGALVAPAGGWRRWSQWVDHPDGRLQEVTGP